MALDQIGGFLGQEMPHFVFTERALAHKFLTGRKEEYAVQQELLAEQIAEMVGCQAYSSIEKKRTVLAERGHQRRVLTTASDVADHPVPAQRSLEA